MKNLLFLLSICCFLSVKAQDKAPSVLIVIAHPDDESGFAATIYKITHELHGTADLFLVTNGEGGYKYSTLAESIYGLELTNEKIGRANLPRIRKQELQNAGKIIGIREFFFMDQKDAHYGLDEREPLDTSWNVPAIQKKLHEVLTKGHYDYVFCLLPVPETHGGHKGASLMALRAVKDIPEKDRPIILGGGVSGKSDTTVRKFTQLKEYTETHTDFQTSQFSVDRTTKFGFKNALNYKIIVNWEIAEHKSQGVMQMGMGYGDIENFWYFSISPKGGIDKCRALFEKLKVAPYLAKKY